MKKYLFLILFSILYPMDCYANEFKPAIIFDVSGKFDKSFGESAYDGIERFKKDYGIDYIDFTLTNESQRTQAIKRMAKKADIVFTVGHGFATPLEQVAKKYKSTNFVIFDMPVKGENIQAVLYKDHEGSFLVGMLAAMKSKSGKIGFIGGKDVPIIRRFKMAYSQGAHYFNPDIIIYSTMMGVTDTAWNDPAKGAELAKGQIDRGVDVIFAAAGGTGIGVYQAAADNKVYAIGVDSNQNYLHPGFMLTSMVKKIDQAVYDALVSMTKNEFKAGFRYMGLKENGVDFAYDKHNKKLITKTMLSTLNQSKQQIISGNLKVKDYLQGKSSE